MTPTLAPPATQADAPFIDCIIAEPDSDGPRLVYSDWLEERGDERGEFIRVGVELAKLEAIRIVNSEGEVCGWKRKKDRDRHDTLTARSRELLARHGIDWAQPVADVLEPIKPSALVVANNGISRIDGRRADGDELIPVASWTWARGFIDTIQLPTLAAWLGERCDHRWHTRSVVGSTSVCPKCRTDTGRTNALGPRLVRATPLREVRFSDREPVYYDSTTPATYDWWLEGSLGRFVSDPHQRGSLPREIMTLLTSADGDEYAEFPSTDAATLALSHAALTWAKGAT